MSINLLQLSILAGAVFLSIIIGALISGLVTKKKYVRKAQEIENNLTEQIEGLREELAVAEGRFTAENKKTEKLIAEKKRLKQKLVDADEQLRELKELQQVLEEEEQKVKELEETKSELSDLLNGRDGQIADQEKVIAELKAERDAQGEELEQKKQELDRLNDKQRGISDELKRANEEHAQRVEAMQQEIESYKKRVDEAEQSTVTTLEKDNQLKEVIEKYASEIAREIVKS